jgi:ATP-dependent Lhr-like helicase
MTRDRSDLARMMPDAFPVFFTGRQPYPGQAMVMPEVVRGHNMLFAAPTASGKTEAVVAPLYQRHISFKRRNLSTVYVAPTKALVNDLYERLLGYLVTRQSGAVARYTGDRHELRTASGVFCLLATPEALDSLQLRRPEMLAGVRAIVVDEIHLLHGQPRGQQLRHVIARIGRVAAPPTSSRDGFQIVGMTATLDDMASIAKLWLGEGAKVLSHGVPRDIDLHLIDLDGDGDADRKRARALARWLNQATAEKVLVFANSRNGAHALAAHLHRELEGTRWPVHLHFGALAAVERERVEDEMRTKRYGVCIATTTLEIGIDIGDVDTIVLSDPPRSVSGFLQRIGRGNRRTGVCRVLAFRASEGDERLIRALMDCARRGELDDIHEYDRPSVRFQQVLSLCWRATRQDRPLSIAALCAEAGTEDHKVVINDMIETGSLTNVRGALIPCDRLMDEADAGRIHSVIAGRAGNTVVDMRTGETAIRDTDETTVGGAIFHGGSLRRLMPASDGGAYLGSEAQRSQPLARIKGTGPALPMSRTIIWALARQSGFDPARWQLDGDELVTWGGEILNTLLAALLTRAAPGRRFTSSLEGITGAVTNVDLSIIAIRDLAFQTEHTADLPLDVAGKFTNPSRFFRELSPTLSAYEKRNSIPWRLFHRWLDSVTGIDGVGSIPNVKFSCADHRSED